MGVSGHISTGAGNNVGGHIDVKYGGARLFVILPLLIYGIYVYILDAPSPLPYLIIGLIRQVNNLSKPLHGREYVNRFIAFKVLSNIVYVGIPSKGFVDNCTEMTVLINSLEI